MTKFKRGDMVRHKVFTTKIGVVTDVNRVTVNGVRGWLRYDVWWNDNSGSQEPARDIESVETK